MTGDSLSGTVQTLLPDGGEARPENCECDDFQTDGDLPCAACWIAGFETRKAGWDDA